MEAIYRMKLNELTPDLIKKIKNTFKNDDLEITIKEDISKMDDTSYLLKSMKNKEILLNRLNDINSGANIVVPPQEPFQ